MSCLLISRFVHLTDHTLNGILLHVPYLFVGVHADLNQYLEKAAIVLWRIMPPAVGEIEPGVTLGQHGL